MRPGKLQYQVSLLAAQLRFDAHDCVSVSSLCCVLCLLCAIVAQVYLGAPWNWCNKGIGDWCTMGGNGGLSYRRRSVMLDLTREIGCTDWRCDWVDLYPQGQHGNDNWKHVRRETDMGEGRSGKRAFATVPLREQRSGRCFPQCMIRFSFASCVSVCFLSQVEDTYFARMLYDRRHKYQGRLATPDQMSEFCIESIPGPDDQEIQPWFVHKIWAFIKHQRYIPIMARTKQYYPELWKK